MCKPQIRLQNNNITKSKMVTTAASGSFILLFSAFMGIFTRAIPSTQEILLFLFLFVWHFAESYLCVRPQYVHPATDSYNYCGTTHKSFPTDSCIVFGKWKPTSTFNLTVLPRKRTPLIFRCADVSLCGVAERQFYISLH